MPGTWGGARPGAGRKPDDAVHRQEAHRDMVLTLAEMLYRHDDDGNIDVDLPDLTIAQAMTLATMKRAIQGDPIAFGQLFPYIAGGKPRQPLEVQGSIDLNLIDWSKPWSPPVLSIDGTSTELPPPKDQVE